MRMEYIFDKDCKYLDELLFHLRAHNTSFTGPKEKTVKHIYVYDSNQLVGYSNPGLSWDWVGNPTLYYQTIDVLKAIVLETVKQFPNVNGFKAFTTVEQRKDDLLQSGYLIDTVLYAEKRLGQTYYLELKDSDIVCSKEYLIVVEDEELEEHKEFIQTYKDDYTKKHNLNKLQEEWMYVAIENDTFAGGVKCEVYQDSMYVDLLAVKNDFKGRGIGTVLMNLAEEQARLKKLEFIDLGTAEFQAKSFYEKLGYQVVHTRKNQPTGFECYSLIKRLKYENELDTRSEKL